MDSAETEQESRERRRMALEKAIAEAEEPIFLTTFRRQWNSAARPFLARGIDKQEYVVKGQQAGRQIINDQIVARLGVIMGAPKKTAGVIGTIVVNVPPSEADKMGSKYSVIQYVPNPIANERINIGVVTFNNEQVRVQFLQNWERVRHFGMENIDFLKDFTERMHDAVKSGLLFPGDEKNDTPNYERLMNISRDWINSIQFTEPRGSLEDVDSLLEDASSNYLIEPSSQKPKIRDRQVAARITISKIKKVLQHYIQDKNDAKELLKTNYRLRGNHDDHKVDVFIANGQPYLAAHGISFEEIQENVQRSLCYMILDVKASNPNLAIAIVTLPPIKDVDNYQELEKNYRQTTSIYEELGANVLQEDEVENWTFRMLENANILQAVTPSIKSEVQVFT